MSDERSSNLEMQAAMNVKQAAPFFMVSDIEASLRYYIGGLGFKMAHQRWMGANSVGAGLSWEARQ